ncbi:maleylpyruvate isomerase N-terminal domain-containing protein [Cryobacterium sp. MDB2-33-2]|uniref:maleylpyruvate isomerase N-terminal domain-containing protein n=1 Tax=Cryobacterium sp. MDB2-33-2 TaxID=1259179 RepID=UPI0018E0AF4A|nr:maleylpyruvate isomerase N-terminal domain-containing protein [Cryobacterium sp. MDB2-33-2]
MNKTREAYLSAAAAAVAIVANKSTAACWFEESTLSGMSVGVLASHLARSVLQVGWFLDGDVTDGPLVVSASTYYARLTDTIGRGSALNTGVERRSGETAQQGPVRIASEAQLALTRLQARLTNEPADRRVAIAHRPGEELLLDEYLRTRLVEIAVHIEDLALSVGIDACAPESAVSMAAELLIEAARERHGDAAVLRALTRRERDDVEALRVL